MVKGLGPPTIVTNQKTNDGRTNTNTKSEVADDDDDLITQVNQRLIWSRQFHRPIPQTTIRQRLLSTH